MEREGVGGGRNTNNNQHTSLKIFPYFFSHQNKGMINPSFPPSPMLENHIYNLLNILVEESRSRTRIAQYLEDASDCPDCQELLKEMEADEEKHIEKLWALVQKHAA